MADCLSYASKEKIFRILEFVIHLTHAIHITQVQETKMCIH